jgi:hypothetical protein
MTYVCPTWEYAADAHILKLQRLQNRVLHAVGNLDKYTSVPGLHVALKIPYLYDYVIRATQQAKVIRNHVNENVRVIGQGEASHRKFKRLKLGEGQAYDRSADLLQFPSCCIS